MSEGRAYRILLRLLPGRLRRRFGQDMEDVFLHRLATARGPIRRGRVWARAVGDVVFEAVRERLPWSREAERGGGEMENWMRDTRHAARALARSPAFTAMAVVTVALGIGASTATFSVVDGVMLKPLPYQEPERLVAVWPDQNFNAAMVREMVASSPALTSATGISGWTLTLTGAGDPLEVKGARVSVDHFRVLGATPLLGRDFRPEDGVPGSDAVVVLSHAFWVRVFGADPGVVGRTIALGTNDHPTRTVVGVMPPDFVPVVRTPEVWIPLAIPASAGMAEDDS